MTTFRIFTAVTVLLLSALFACSDDTDPPVQPDSAVDSAVVDAAIDAAPPDTTPADKAIPDKPHPDYHMDGDKAKALTSGHGGYKDPACGDCHKLPVNSWHAEIKPWQCAACHGGNGACKQPANHDATGCTQSGCHTSGGSGPALPASHKNFSTDQACIDCHLATAGVVACTP
jgi:hypothetical protein